MTVLSIILGCLVGGVLGYLLRARLGGQSADAANAYRRGVVDAERRDALERARDAPARKAEIEAAFLKGKEAAAADVTVELTPYKEIDEGIVWTSAVVGYRKQILVRGLPVGEPSLVVLERRSRVDKQQLNQMLALVQPAIEEAAKAFVRQGVRAMLK